MTDFDVLTHHDVRQLLRSIDFAQLNEAQEAMVQRLGLHSVTRYDTMALIVIGLSSLRTAGMSMSDVTKLMLVLIGAMESAEHAPVTLHEKPEKS